MIDQMSNKFKLPLYIAFAILVAGLLSGCDMVLFQPKGSIAAEQIRLIIISVILMLIIVIPVIVMTLVIAWRYRASNTKATYAPNWEHNTKLEVVWWAVPCVIVFVLAWITWVTSHSLDPYKPLESKAKPVTIQAVSLDWKWLFIYPDQHIATVNFLEIPEKTPINFQITADAPMNSLWIPALGGQIYAMPGMRTKLHLIADGVGEYKGLSSNFSGDGFAGMKFNVKSVSSSDFSEWVQTVKNVSPNQLTPNAYTLLAKPSENTAVQYYSFVPDGLFNRIMMKFMMPANSLEGMSNEDMKNMNMAKMMAGDASITNTDNTKEGRN